MTACKAGLNGVREIWIVARSFDFDGGTIVNSNRYMELVREHWDEISAYKEAIANKEYGEAYTFWDDIEPEHANILSGLAPSYGGVLTTDERDVMKSNKWAAARNELLQ